MEWNAESVLDALNDFERKPEINPILDEYLQRIAKNGEIIFPWGKLKPLLKKKLEVVLDEFYETCPVETSVPVPNFETFNFDNLKKTILQAVDAFTSAPFTIQRLCELVTNPQKHYNRTDKYMRGIEKNVLVVSTIEPRTGGQGEANNANNNVIVNGMLNDSLDENDALNGHENESTDSVSSSNINTPSNHVLLENFANVFPSAACIPSASNICINREIDTNFIPTSECVETQEEVDFEASAATSTEQPAESVAETKEEAMDTTEEESTSVVDNGKMSTGDVSESPEMPEAEEKKSENEPSSESTIESVPSVSKMDSPSSSEQKWTDISETADSSTTEMDSTDIIEKVEEEVDSSEALDETPAVLEEIIKPNKKSNQDDTVSQSDDTSSDSADIPEVKETIDECDSEISENKELKEETVPEVESSVVKEVVSNASDKVETEPDNESVEQSMELESDNCSGDPPE